MDATERWPLLFEYTGSVVDNLRQLHPASVSVDVHANSWQSEELIQQAERALRTGTTLVWVELIQLAANYISERYILTCPD